MQNFTSQRRRIFDKSARMIYYDFFSQFYEVSLVKETVLVCYTHCVRLYDSWDVIYELYDFVIIYVLNQRDIRITHKVKLYFKWTRLKYFVYNEVIQGLTYV